MKIGIYFNQRIDVGGGYYEAIESIQKIIDSNFHTNVEIYTSNKSNLATLDNTKLKIKFINLNVFWRLILTFRRFIFDIAIRIIPGNTIPVILIKKLMFRFNHFEKLFIQNNVDIVYFTSPDANAIYLENLNFIFPVWDLAHIEKPYFPELLGTHAYDTREFLYRKVLLKAYAITVGHQYAKEQVSKYYQVPENKIFLIPFKASKYLRNYSDKGLELKRKKERYLYYPAQYNAHKNHIVILKALKEIIKTDKFKNMKVVFSGSDKGNKKYLLNYVKKNNIEKNVIFKNFISDEEVYSLYRNASAVIMPSYVGPATLPTLEAMYLGIPLILPDFDFNVTFYEDSCLFFDNTEPSSVIACLDKLEENPILKKSIIMKGKLKYSQYQNSSELDKLNRHIYKYSSFSDTYENEF